MDVMHLPCAAEATNEDAYRSFIHGVWYSLSTTLSFETKHSLSLSLVRFALPVRGVGGARAGKEEQWICRSIPDCHHECRCFLRR
jgi:hypothetical protein